MSMGCTISSRPNEQICYRNCPHISYDPALQSRLNKTQHDVVVQISTRRHYRSGKITKRRTMDVPIKASTHVRALPTENDFRFIEQRVISCSDSYETECTAVSTVDTKNSTTSDEEGKAIGAPKFHTNLSISVHSSDKQYSIKQLATVFSIAKRLEELKNPQLLSEPKTSEETQNAVAKESPRIE
uniref:Uncharacterized protein n=1 Tax=Parascaris univalens TaxID=6257 RepID=A0A914ZSH2_PARUN